MWFSFIRSFLLAMAIPSAGPGFYFVSNQDAPVVPEPDRSAMEPHVAAKVEEYRESVIAEPKSHGAWGRLGMILHAHGFEMEAAKCYEWAVALEPEGFRWHYLLALALRDWDNARALDHAERASDLRPRYFPTYVLRGEILEEDNQPEGALEQYAKAVAVDPRCAEAEFGLGRLYLAQGDLEVSLNHLKRAADLKEDAAAIRAVLTLVYRRLGDREAAVREARLASELTGRMRLNDPVYFQMRREDVSSSTLLRRAIAAEEAGAYKKAEALYRGLLEVRPDDANLHVNLGNTLARQDKLQAAREQYLHALGMNPENASALFGLGNVLSSEGKLEEAAGQYRRALEVRPAHVLTLVYLGRILAFQGNLTEATTHLRRALELDTQSFDAHLDLGHVLLRQDHVEEAIPHLRAALEVRPSSGPVHLRLAMALAGAGAHQDARKHAERAQELGEIVPPNLLEELRRGDPRRP